MTYKNEIFCSPWASLQCWNDSESRRNETVSVCERERERERERGKKGEWKYSIPSLRRPDSVWRSVVKTLCLSLISLNYWQPFSLHTPNRINSLERKEAANYTDAPTVPFSHTAIIHLFRNMNNVLLSESFSYLSRAQAHLETLESRTAGGLFWRTRIETSNPIF